MATRISTASATAAANAVVDSIDLGAGTAKVRVYTGTQPATANTTASGTLLVEFDLPNPAFGAASSGVATANAISNATATASGTAGWFRCVDRDNAAVLDGSVTATGGGGDMTMNTTTVTSGAAVSITSWTVTMPTT